MSQDDFNEEASNFEWVETTWSDINERLDALNLGIEESTRAVEQLLVNIEFLRIMVVEDLI